MKKIILSLALLTITGLSYGLVGDLVRGAGEVAGDTVDFAGDVARAPFGYRERERERIDWDATQPEPRVRYMPVEEKGTTGGMGYEVTPAGRGYQTGTAAGMGYEAPAQAGMGYQAPTETNEEPAHMDYVEEKNS